MDKKTIYLFYGHDNYTAQQKLNRWRTEFEKKYGDLNIQIFDGDDFTASNFSEAIETVPFLSDKKLIIIRDFLRDAKEEDQKGVAEKLDDADNFNIIVFIEHEKPDARTTLFKKLNKTGQAIEFEDLDTHGLTRWIEQEFARKSGGTSGNTGGGIGTGKNAGSNTGTGGGTGKNAGSNTGTNIGTGMDASTIAPQQQSIGSREALFLAETVGPNLWQMSQEVEKLSLYSRSQPLNVEAIEALASPNVSASIFKLTDYLAQKNSRSSIKTLSTLIQSGEDLFRIFSMIVRHFRILIQIKACIEKKMERQQIIQKTKEHPFAISQGMSQCKNFNFEKLGEIYGKLLQIDIAAKSSRIKTTTGDNSELRLSLEKLIVELCS